MKVSVTSRIEIPFFESLITAGFPSAATDYIDRVCDLNDLCIRHPEATYFVWVVGDSMIDNGIGPGDVLIVDSSLKATDGKIAVV